MSKISLAEDFQQSYLNYPAYPLNFIIIGTNTCYSTLESYKNRLDILGNNLCLENESQVEVPIRDLSPSPNYFSKTSPLNNHKKQHITEVSKCNIHTAKKLDQWLGTEVTLSKGKTDFKSVMANAKDPKCRFIYIYAEHSRDKLRITRKMLAHILTYHQVMPAYLDFMFVFGSQSDPRDLRFSSFREQIAMKMPPRLPSMPGLGRSGRQYQLCYNLKGVTLKSQIQDSKLNEWSIRQAAIHHQFDVVYGTTLWVITKGRLDLQERFKRLTGQDGKPEDKAFYDLADCFRSSLAAHLMYCYWSTEDWRWYICWLESIVDAETSMAVYGPRGTGHSHRQYKPYDIQELQHWKDKACEVVAVLEASAKVIIALGEFYRRLKSHEDFPSSLLEDCKGDIDSFVLTLNELVNGLKMHVSRARHLTTTINDRKELVLQHLQGQSTERTEQLNLNLEKEAIVMRIITTVTLLYLPATFVSTFFSTDIIKYQNPNGGKPGPGTFSPTAMSRWLQVTLPLTVVTLFVAWLTYKIAAKSGKGGEANIKTPASFLKQRYNISDRFRAGSEGNLESPQYEKSVDDSMNSVV